MILMRKYFIKKNFYFRSVLILLLTFNFSKNFIRIYEANFQNNPYKHIKNIEWYRIPVKKNVDSFTYYKGWIDAYPLGNMDLENYKHRKFLFFDIIYK